MHSVTGVNPVRNLAKSAGMSDAGYDTMSDVLYWGCVAGNTYAGYRALMPKGKDLIRASNTASEAVAGASRAAKNASGNGKTSSASQKSNSPYKTLEKNGIPSTLSVAERETLDAGNYKMMYSGGSNTNVVEVKISRSKYPESAKHIEDAIANGHPEILTIDRTGSKANRRASLKGIDKVPGKDLDEYPPAMFKEGGKGASVRPINPSDNRGAGSTFGHELRPYPNGTKIKYKIIDD